METKIPRQIIDFPHRGFYLKLHALKCTLQQNLQQMSYRRRSRKRKRGRAFRPGFDRTGGFYGRFNKKRKLTASYTEKKFLDMNLNDASITAVGTFPTATGVEGLANTIVDLPQGTGESARIGRKCTITNIHARFNFEFLAANSATTLVQANIAHETIRLLVGHDKQCNGTGPAAADILEIDEYNSFRNLANSKRFSILYDKIWAWNTSAISEGNGTNRSSERVVTDYQVNVNIKCFIPIEYSSTTGALSEIRSNNLFVMIWSKHGNRMRLASPSKLRIRYIDF